MARIDACDHSAVDPRSGLYIAGQKTIWLPYALFVHLPGFNQVLQGRVALYWILMCSVVLAMWLAAPSRHRAARWVCGLVAVAFVLPNIATGSGNAASWTNPTFFSTGMYKQYLKKGETVLPIRWGWLSESPVWQAETHMYFNLASGYFITSVPPGWDSPLAEDLWDNTPDVSNAPLLRQLVSQRHVSDILVEESQVRAWGPVLRAAGLRVTARVGGVTLYHIPSTWLASKHGGA